MNSDGWNFRVLHSGNMSNTRFTESGRFPWSVLQQHHEVPWLLPHTASFQQSNTNPPTFQTPVFDLQHLINLNSDLEDIEGSDEGL